MAIAAGALIDAGDYAGLPFAKAEVSTTQTLPTTIGALPTPVEVSIVVPRPAIIEVVLSGLFGEGGGAETAGGTLAVSYAGALSRTPSSLNRALRGTNYAQIEGGSYVEYHECPAGTLDLEVWGLGISPCKVRGVSLTVVAQRWNDL